MSVAKHTQGPWYWHVDCEGRVSLRTPDRGNLIVMDPWPTGPRKATLRFAVWPGMTDGADRARLGGILENFDPNHPDARLIVAAPVLVATLVSIKRLLNDISDTDYPVSDELEQVNAALGAAGVQP